MWKLSLSVRFLHKTLGIRTHQYCHWYMTYWHEMKAVSLICTVLKLCQICEIAEKVAFILWKIYDGKRQSSFSLWQRLIVMGTSNYFKSHSTEKLQSGIQPWQHKSVPRKISQMLWSVLATAHDLLSLERNNATNLRFLCIKSFVILKFKLVKSYQKCVQVMNYAWRYFPWKRVTGCAVGKKPCSCSLSRSTRSPFQHFSFPQPKITKCPNFLFKMPKFGKFSVPKPKNQSKSSSGNLNLG